MKNEKFLCPNCGASKMANPKLRHWCKACNKAAPYRMHSVLVVNLVKAIRVK